jgi:luciferase family oxidoreductase group 1
VVELMDYFAATKRHAVKAVPGAGLKVPVWILGSSLFGAQLAAALGLPYAFASHFAPAQMMQAVALYRANFKPSAQLQQPYVMLGFNIFAADTDEQAQFLATSMQQAFVNLRSGHPQKLQAPVADYLQTIAPHEKAMLDQVLSCAAIGAPQTVKEKLKDFIEQTGADELMITSQIFDHAARLSSYEITAEIRAGL